MRVWNCVETTSRPQTATPPGLDHPGAIRPSSLPHMRSRVWGIKNRAPFLVLRRRDEKDGRCGFRFLDPTISVFPVPLPGTERGLIGATRRGIFHSAAPAGFWPAGLSLLGQRTNLLSPSVAHLPVFKIAQITATSIHYRALSAARQYLFPRRKFPQDICPSLNEIWRWKKSPWFLRRETIEQKNSTRQERPR